MLLLEGLEGLPTYATRLNCSNRGRRVGLDVTLIDHDHLLRLALFQVLFSGSYQQPDSVGTQYRTTGLTEIAKDSFAQSMGREARHVAGPCR